MSLSAACKEIEDFCTSAKSTGRSQCFRRGSHGHLSGIRHHYESSSRYAYLSVEPGDGNDLAEIMKVIKKRKVPFAVKGGGHATNPGFSSTEGIHISMSRFFLKFFSASAILGSNKESTIVSKCHYFGRYS